MNPQRIWLKYKERIRGSWPVSLADLIGLLVFGAFCAFGRCHGDQLICDKIISGRFAHSIQMFSLCALAEIRHRFGYRYRYRYSRPDADTDTDTDRRTRAQSTSGGLEWLEWLERPWNQIGQLASYLARSSWR